MVKTNKQDMNVINQEAKNLERFSMLRADEKSAVQEFAKVLSERFGSMVKEIILFGSKARKSGDKESDIDILIVLTDLSWEIKKSISELAAEENLKHNVLISTVRYDVTTWENPVIKASPFGKSVREEGIWL